MNGEARTTSADELRMLRARAYGPDADIHTDPAAMERLRELEEPILVAETGVPEARASDTTEPASVEVDTETEPEPAELEPEGIERASGWRRFVPATRRGWVAAAAAFLAVTVVVTAGITTAVVREVQADPRTIAVLPADPSIELGDAFSGYGSMEPSVAHADFHGLTPIVIPGWVETGGRCLLLTPTTGLDASANGWSSIGGMNCESGSFPSDVQFIVSDDFGLPTEFRDHFPDGTALQFVLDGTSVIVLEGTTG